ncbi:MAG: toll/interleukin-1 receptor domain-containing protein [Candidatus Competibacteraceae bacterium]
MDALDERDWDRLTETVRRKRCILLLGPGVAVAPGDDPPIPLTTRLARALAAQLPVADVCDPDSLSHVAQLYYQHPDFSRLDLERAVKDFYKSYEQESTQLHRELAQLPFTLCVNTAFDRFFLNALRAADKTPVYDYYHFRKGRDSPLNNIDPAYFNDPKEPVVYDLYGSREDEESLVLSENDLLEFLVKVIQNVPPLPAFIKARFSDPNASFLFLGFGFRHWYVRILLHILQAQRRQNPSLALEDAGFFKHPEQRQIAIFFEKEHRIAFRQQDCQRFAVELRRRFAESGGPMPPPAPVLPEDAPRVFLCYSHQDREAVNRLVESLQTCGIAIWMDRQNLRGGDDWDRLIPDVIKKQQVDYVVVAQSRALAGRVESYCYKEITTALERQASFAQGMRFVIPVQLDAGILLPELERLQSVDITAPQGLQELVKTIQEDWSRRGRRRSV